MKFCAYCDAEMPGRKSTAVYCNSTCRGRASEARQRGEGIEWASRTFWTGIARCRRSVPLRRKSTRLDRDAATG